MRAWLDRWVPLLIPIVLFATLIWLTVCVMFSKNNCY